MREYSDSNLVIQFNTSALNVFGGKRVAHFSKAQSELLTDILAKIIGRKQTMSASDVSKIDLQESFEQLVANRNLLTEDQKKLLLLAENIASLKSVPDSEYEARVLSCLEKGGLISDLYDGAAGRSYLLFAAQSVTIPMATGGMGLDVIAAPDVVVDRVPYVTLPRSFADAQEACFIQTGTTDHGTTLSFTAESRIPLFSKNAEALLKAGWEPKVAHFVEGLQDSFVVRSLMAGSTQFSLPLKYKR